MHVAPRGPGVDGEAEPAGCKCAPADSLHADEEHADEDADAQAFLDEFQPQEELGRAAGLEKVQVDNLQVPGGVGNAENLQIRNAFLPAGAVAQVHDGLGEGGGEQTQPGNGQGEKPHVAPVYADEFLRAVLQSAQDGEGNLIEHVAKHRGAHGGQLGSVLVPGQGSGGIHFADEECACVDVDGIEQSGGSQSAAQRGKFPERVHAESPTRAPGTDEPEEQRVNQGRDNALCHVGPHTPALPGQQQAQGHGYQR